MEIKLYFIYQENYTQVLGFDFLLLFFWDKVNYVA